MTVTARQSASGSVPLDSKEGGLDERGIAAVYDFPSQLEPSVLRGSPSECPTHHRSASSVPSRPRSLASSVLTQQRSRGISPTTHGSTPCVTALIVQSTCWRLSPAS